jgi:hypothetical protein
MFAKSCEAHTFDISFIHGFETRVMFDFLMVWYLGEV